MVSLHILFYTFLGFQRYQICNFWPSRTLYNDFTSSAHFLKFENRIWIRFDSNWLGQDTWHVLVGRYQFSRIFTEGHQIKRERNIPDLRIPLRVSDLILATRSGSNSRRQRGEGSPGKHTDGEVRWVWRSMTGCSGGLLALGKSGRGVGHCGENGSKIGGVDFFLELEGGATEAAPGDGEM
jgi:hypothetical protein